MAIYNVSRKRVFTEDRKAPAREVTLVGRYYTDNVYIYNFKYNFISLEKNKISSTIFSNRSFILFALTIII